MPPAAARPATTTPPPRRRPFARRLWELTAGFGRAGLFGFGGGPAFIPLIQREVETYGWLSRAAFLDAFAFGNALPGPITTKLAGFIGFRVAGPLGAVVALLALTAPTIVAMVALAALYQQFREADAVRGFLVGMRPVVIALLVMTVVTFAPSALGPAGAWRANLLRWGLALAAFVAAIALGWHPGVLILAGGAVGLALGRSS